MTDREIHFHFQIGADATQIVDQVKAATASLARLETKMAELDEKLDATLNKLSQLKTHVAAETQQVLDKVTAFQKSIDDLTAQRDALQKIIDAGVGLTPEQQAKLDQINTALDDATTAVDQVDPETPTTVPPTP